MIDVLWPLAICVASYLLARAYTRGPARPYVTVHAGIDLSPIADAWRHAVETAEKEGEMSELDEVARVLSYADTLDDAGEADALRTAAEVVIAGNHKSLRQRWPGDDPHSVNQRAMFSDVTYPALLRNHGLMPEKGEA